MSDEELKVNEEGSDLPSIDELTVLKQRANQMGIRFSPNIGIEALRTKIGEALNGSPKEEEEAPEEAPKEVKETKGQFRARKRKEANKLVRIRLTCLNPVKKEWPGEVFTFVNSVVGTIRKFIPFEGADDGYHVPVVIYNMLKARKCQVFVTVKDSRGGKVRQGKQINEFAIEVLPPLTKEELEDLAVRQAASYAID